MKNDQDFLNFITANNTLSQLNSTFNQTFILAQQFNITNYEISIEPEFNNVIIYLKNDEKNKKFIEKVETLNPSPIIKLLPNEEKEEKLFNSSILVEKSNLNILVNGGSRIVNLNANGVLACSAGFWMKKNNEDFIVTAGHCPDHFPSLFYVNSFQDEHLIGPMNSRFTGSYDMGFIKKTNTNIMLRPVIRQFDMINLRFLQFFIVGSSEITSCGIHICIAGEKTGISSGFVIAINSISEFSDRVLIRTIVVPNMRCIHSDSGGSMFRYNGLNGQSNIADAVGIFIGGVPGIRAIVILLLLLFFVHFRIHLKS
ncbi:hypothetical protein C2G38_2030498 [Gigaspora rosea]|uniref:Peptidase S1 domain-containing protein n=1 Tax=Gigaspora rosea TaxID=44941 RepID=A0A397VXP3_9GLOM|nr:hypothetical protein C2G38_2030498 [Gigaspora rosea]